MSQADLVEDYLRELGRELGGRPRGRRDDLVDEIRGHIRDALGDDPTEAEVRTVLDRIGDPAEIAAEERERGGDVAGRRPVLEVVALIALVAGSVLLPIVGWLVAVALVWMSRIWTRGDKLLATLAPPLGLGGPLLLLSGGVGGYTCYSTGTGEVCPGEPPELLRAALIVGVVLAVVAAVAVPMRLGSRLRARRAAPYADPMPA